MEANQANRTQGLLTSSVQSFLATKFAATAGKSPEIGESGEADVEELEERIAAYQDLLQQNEQ